MLKPNGTPFRILLAEDSIDTQRLIHFCLSSAEFEVVVVGDGAQALDWILSHPLPDLVITDLRMPKMNGFELLKVLKEKQIDVPVIVVALKTEEQDTITSFHYGAKDFIEKPFSPKDMVSKISSLLAAC